jgi:hypothetical protein
MFLDASTWQALAIVGAVGGVGGLLGGLISGAHNLLGTILMGIIGGITAATIARIVGAPLIYEVGEGFSLVWSAIGGILLGFVVGRSNV